MSLEINPSKLFRKIKPETQPPSRPYEYVPYELRQFRRPVKIWELRVDRLVLFRWEH